MGLKIEFCKALRDVEGCPDIWHHPELIRVMVERGVELEHALEDAGWMPDLRGEDDGEEWED